MIIEKLLLNISSIVQVYKMGIYNNQLIGVINGSECRHFIMPIKLKSKRILVSYHGVFGVPNRYFVSALRWKYGLS